jgi:hypothetical protein
MSSTASRGLFNLTGRGENIKKAPDASVEDGKVMKRKSRFGVLAPLMDERRQQVGTLGTAPRFLPPYLPTLSCFHLFRSLFHQAG